MYTVAVAPTAAVQLPDRTSQSVPVNRAALADLASKTGARSFTAQLGRAAVGARTSAAR